jgi:large-conductance mechanosensitive channel
VLQVPTGVLIEYREQGDELAVLVFGFVLVAFAVFLLIRQVNRLKGAEKPVSPTTKDCPYCFSAIALKATRCPHCTSALAAT